MRGGGGLASAGRGEAVTVMLRMTARRVAENFMFVRHSELLEGFGVIGIKVNHSELEYDLVPMMRI